MTDSHISVSREYHEEERAGDLVDGGGGEVDLAHGHAKGPLPQCHGGNQEGNSNQETFISHRQVKDICVGDCVHFRKPGEEWCH